MNATVCKWGNSLSVRIPKSYIQLLDLKENSPLDIFVSDGNLIIKPVKATMRNKIEARFDAFEKNGCVIEGELPWEAIGEEVW